MSSDNADVSQPPLPAAVARHSARAVKLSVTLMTVYVVVYAFAWHRWLLTDPPSQEWVMLAGVTGLLVLIAVVPEPPIIDRGRVHAIPLIVIVAGIAAAAWPQYGRMDAGVAVIASLPALVVNGWLVAHRNRSVYLGPALWRTGQLVAGIVTLYAVMWATYPWVDDLPLEGTGTGLAVAVTVTYVLSLRQHRARHVQPVAGFRRPRPAIVRPSRHALAVMVWSAAALIVIPLTVIAITHPKYPFAVQLIAAIASMVPVYAMVAWWTTRERRQMAADARIHMWEGRREYVKNRNLTVRGTTREQWSITADEEKMVQLLLTALRDGLLVTDAVVTVYPMMGNPYGNIYVAHDMDVAWGDTVPFTRTILQPRTGREINERFARDNDVPIVKFTELDDNGHEHVIATLAAVPNSTDTIFRGLPDEIERFGQHWVSELSSLTRTFFVDPRGAMTTAASVAPDTGTAGDLPLYGLILRKGGGDEFISRVKRELDLPDAPIFAMHVRLNPLYTHGDFPFNAGQPSPIPKTVAMALAAANLTFSHFHPEPIMVNDGTRGLVVVGVDPYNLIHHRMQNFREMLTAFLRHGIGMGESSFGGTAFASLDTTTHSVARNPTTDDTVILDRYLSIAVVRDDDPTLAASSVADLIEAAQAETEAEANGTIVTRTAILQKITENLTNPQDGAYQVQYVPLINPADLTVTSYRHESFWQDPNGVWQPVPRLLEMIHDPTLRANLIQGAVERIVAGLGAIRASNPTFPLRVSIDHDILLKEGLLPLLQSTLAGGNLTWTNLGPLTVTLHNITHDTRTLHRTLETVRDTSTGITVAVALRSPDLMPLVVDLPLINEVSLEPELSTAWRNPVRADEIRAIIDTAHKRDLLVSALGVTRSRQFRDLRQWGVNLMEVPATLDTLPLSMTLERLRHSHAPDGTRRSLISHEEGTRLWMLADGSTGAVSDHSIA